MTTAASRTAELLGGHPLPSLPTTRKGFWIQNSWGTDWGRDGFGASMSYDRLLGTCHTDVWGRAARRALSAWSGRKASAAASAAAAPPSPRLHVTRPPPHIVSIGNLTVSFARAALRHHGRSLRLLFAEDFPIGLPALGKKKRLLLYAHGGLTE